MLSAIVSLPAACDLLASYTATPLAAARNKAPGFQASFGVRKWVEGATITVEYVSFAGTGPVVRLRLSEVAPPTRNSRTAAAASFRLTVLCAHHTSELTRPTISCPSIDGPRPPPSPLLPLLPALLRRPRVAEGRRTTPIHRCRRRGRRGDRRAVDFSRRRAAAAAKAEAAAGGTGGGASRRLQSSAAASSRDPCRAAHRRRRRRWERRRVCRLLCAAPAHAAASNGQPERPAAAAVARQRCALAQPRAKLCFQNRMLLVSQVPREHGLAVGGHRLAVRRREVLKIPVHDRGVRGVPAFGAHQPVVDGLVDPIHSKLP